ncbi:MAG TPA: hypothetical protein VEA44_04185 [Caulobacter sp.]|nr:hypothetical protein [Caulobacter sp.]
MQSYILHLTRAGADEPEVVSITVGRESRARELALELLGRWPDAASIKAWLDGVPVFELTAAPSEPSAGSPGSSLFR